MNIIKATINDLVEVLFLLKECVADLNSKGLKHWNNAYPGAEALIKAIEDEELYFSRDIGVAKGMLILSEESPDEYTKIDWKADSSKVLNIKFFAIHPIWHGSEVAKNLLNFAEEHAKQNNFTSLRIDMHSGVDLADKLSNDFGFDKSGEFHTSFQAKPYLAYEKGL